MNSIELFFNVNYFNDSHSERVSKMSLKLKIELEQLKQEESRLLGVRANLHSSEIKKAVEEIKADAEKYLTGMNLTVSKKEDKMVFSYNGKEFITLDFTGFEVSNYGVRRFDISYDGKPFIVQLQMDQNEKVPTNNMTMGTEIEVLQKNIDFYKHKLLPALTDSSSKQLPGTYALVLAKQGNDNKIFSDINSLLDVITG